MLIFMLKFFVDAYFMSVFVCTSTSTAADAPHILRLSFKA